jgi:hypothetical protein
MQLHEPTPDRKPVHKREVTIDVFLCPDRAWEVDAMIADVPQRSVDMVCGLKQAGDDLHRMQLRLRVARDSNTVLEASAQTIAAPYREHCANHGSIYQALVGLNVLKGFRQAVYDRLGGVAGCTHITELAQMLPTALVQAIAQEAARNRETGSVSAQRPFQLDRCHALRSDNEAVRLFYPQWYRATKDPRTD